VNSGKSASVARDPYVLNLRPFLPDHLAMSMFALARSLRPQVLSPALHCRRWFAEIVTAQLPAPSDTSSQNSLPVPSGAVTTKAVDWRKEKVPVREDHGLYAFFRKKEVKLGADEPEGEDKYEVLETPQNMQTITGESPLCFPVYCAETYGLWEYCRTGMEG
jgi:hypothetical protein